MKTCSNTVRIREMHIKNSNKTPLHLSNWQELKKFDDIKFLERILGKMNHYFFYKHSFTKKSREWEEDFIDKAHALKIWELGFGSLAPM